MRMPKDQFVSVQVVVMDISDFGESSGNTAANDSCNSYIQAG
ncbi:hypothetical protein LSAT2_017265, partial [Lamellibrachia satsuma]